MTKDRHIWIKRTMLAAAAGAAVIALWMIVPVPRRGVTVPDYGETFDFKPSREGGHLLPNLDIMVQGTRIGEPVRLFTNARGYRNEQDFSYTVPDDTCRILFYGDSFVDGMRTDQNQTIGALLQERLSETSDPAPCSRFQVMISGHDNPANAWFNYQEYGHRYNPRLVILGITLGNDITWNNYKAGMEPAETGDGPPRLRWTGNRDSAAGGQTGRHLPAEAYRKRNLFLRWLHRIELGVRRRLAAKSSLFDRAAPPIMVPGRDESGRLDAYGYCVSLGLFYRPPTLETDTMLADMTAVVEGLDAQCEMHGDQLLVVLFPVRIQVSERDWHLLARLYGLDRDAFGLTYPNRFLQERLAVRGIPCVDLLESFREASDSGTPLYRPRGDMHFSIEGNRVAAATLAPAVRALLGKEPAGGAR
jgi:hypothetical protein